MYQKIIKENNENKIFQYLFKSKQDFVINDIATALDISFPTVKRVVNILLKKNVIYEKNKIGDGVGRKATEYGFNRDFCYSIGIKINQDSLHFILINGCCEIQKQHSYYLTLSLANIVEMIIKSTFDFVEGLSAEEQKHLVGVGIATRGIVNHENNFVEFSSTTSFPLKALDIIGEKLGVPVLIENESNLAVVAEAMLGHGQQLNHFVCLTVSDTISCSTFQKEQNDSFSFKAGRIHHMNINPDGNLCECGSQGCLGAYISNRALIYEFQKFFPEIETFSDIFSEKYLKTHFGQLLLDNYIKHMAVGIKNLIFFSNPEKLIITGDICRYKDLVKSKLLKTIYVPNHIFYRGEDTIVFSQFDEKTGIIGAAIFPIVDSLF
ncbi:N-acetylmannosamine kinase [Fusobacterium sp. DD29]|uniref:ROK family protein n=1 Tax=unclassified Fusobacterium TaxID=2648384 RepID=UPI001B8C2B67|nr:MULTISPECIES: ROK family protein [unclassified Fusobacterium]MBR8700597.1 N-acetylmannosamine kinase [Fusobacterium sp. DD45]MBR8710133.1 N-acetylmannosamine kinase [Fusobacterium sp. DD28]MBR8749257.1 N-acetylmannosamine kinase [Fusobacterium sp. DD29]MBR8750874.1 N-acetylmannosamine kinase [Fusobacterium sp. DD26]MBR8761533.1 N-acetylmannosamine kinase [Fusobacterium sp. DD25]